MRGNLSDTMRHLAELRKRAGDITLRIRRDVDALADVHHELADLLCSIGPALMANGSVSAASSAPRPTPPADSSRPPIDAGPRTTRLLRLDVVAARVGLSRSQVWRMVKEGRFPKPRRLSTRAVAWVEADVSGWISGRPVFDGPERPTPRTRRRRTALSER